MARRKNVKRIDPRYFLHETVNRNDDGSAAEETLEEKRGYFEPPDPSDPGWPWEPGESVEGNRPHPYEDQPVLGGIRKRPGESREEYERRGIKGKHRGQWRLPDPGELDPYELEEANWADEREADKPWSYQRSGAGGYSPQVVKPDARKGRGTSRGRMRPRPGETDEEFEKRQAARVNAALGLEEAELEEGCPHAEEGDALDSSSPGMEVYVEDISNLPPEEAFAAGLAAAKDAIDQMLDGAGPAPPEGEGPLEELRRSCRELLRLAGKG